MAMMALSITLPAFRSELVTTMPPREMTETSLVPDAARAVGLSFPDLCEKILEMAGYQR